MASTLECPRARRCASVAALGAWPACSTATVRGGGERHRLQHHGERAGLELGQVDEVGRQRPQARRPGGPARRAPRRLVVRSAMPQGAGRPGRSPPPACAARGRRRRGRRAGGRWRRASPACRRSRRWCSRHRAPGRGATGRCRRRHATRGGRSVVALRRRASVSIAGSARGRGRRGARATAQPSTDATVPRRLA